MSVRIPVPSPSRLRIALATVALAAAGAAVAGTAPDAAAPEPPKVKVDIAPLPPPPEGAPAVPVPAPGPRLAATLVSHAAAGKQPTTCAIVDEGRTLLVTNRGDNSVSVFETAGMTLSKTISEVGYGAWGIAERAPGQLLVANWAGSSLALIDRATGKRTGEVPVGMKPSYIALSSDGKRAYSAGNFSEDVSIADVSGKRTLRMLTVGRRPMGVAASRDGQWLYVAVCDSKKISKIDLTSQAVADTFAAPLASTTNLVLTPGDRKLLAAGEAGRLLIVDTVTGDVEKVATGTDTSSVAVTPDGRVALVTDYAGSAVVLVDLPAREKYATVAVGAGPIHVETDGHRFYTCNDKAGSVSAFRLDPPENATGAGL